MKTKEKPGFRWELPCGCVLLLAALLIALLAPRTARYLALFPLAFGVLFLLLWGSRKLPVRAGKRMRRILWGLTAAAVGIFLVLEGIVFFGGRTDIASTPDVVIVLGCKTNDNGPSPALQSRIDTAAAYLLEHPEVPCIVCGGKGSEEPEAEADVMYQRLVAEGVSGDRITREDQSSNTEENLHNAMEILAQQGYDSSNTTALLVTSQYHVCRAAFLARRYGMTAETLAAPFCDLKEAVNGYLRESLALVKSALFD